MDLASQVCSLELAQKLKELGVKQESLFWWSICRDCEKAYPEGTVEWELSYDYLYKEKVSAFTVAELGSILPDYFCTYRNNKLWKCGWSEERYKLSGKFSSGCKTEADARATLLVYLIENKLIATPANRNNVICACLGTCKKWPYTCSGLEEIN